MNQKIASSLAYLTLLMIVAGIFGLLVLAIIYFFRPKRAKKLSIPLNISREAEFIPYLTPYKEESKPQRLPYRVKDNFLSEAEHSFYHVLRHTLNGEFTICPKVRLLVSKS